MARVLFIIAPKNYRDEELQTPKKLLEDSGHSVDVASVITGTAVGMLGGNFEVSLTVKDALKKDYAGVIVVGGSGSADLAGYPEVLELLRKMDERKKLIASICLAGVVLAKAGVLQGKRSTVWASSAYQQSVRILKDNGARYVNEKIVIDGNIITAFGPDQSYRFAEELASWLEENTA